MLLGLVVLMERASLTLYRPSAARTTLLQGATFSETLVMPKQIAIESSRRMLDRVLVGHEINVKPDQHRRVIACAPSIRGTPEITTVIKPIIRNDVSLHT